MQNELKMAVKPEQSCYDDSEIALMRQQLRTGNAKAFAVFTEEKYPVDPRVAEARAALANAKD